MRSANSEEMRIQYLDEAVAEVFQTMLGTPCMPLDAHLPEESDALAAVTGLAGAMSGVCVLRTGRDAALEIASSLTGMPMRTIDETVKDAMGEICNMIAGTWKGRIPLLAAGCLLSTPAVMEGSGKSLPSDRSALRVERRYRFKTRGFTCAIFGHPAQEGRTF